MSRETRPSRAAIVASLLVCCAPGPERSAVGPTPIPATEGALGVAYDRNAHELVFEMEPVDLPAGADHNIVKQPRAAEAPVPVSGWLKGYRVELIDAQGRVVPNELIHHVNIMAPDRRELFSPIMQRIGAAGHETAPVELPPLLGYRVDEGDRILVTGMLHNPTSSSYTGVRVRVRFRHRLAQPWIRLISVYPFYLDVTPPAELHSFDLPPGYSEKSWQARPAVSGRILGAGGHLHDHAVALRFEDITARRILYEARPVLDQAGHVIGMPQTLFLWRLGLPVRADHTYRLTVAYQNDSGAVIDGGGMGALGGILIASRGATWPAVDPRDPEYVADDAIRRQHIHSEMVGAPADPGTHRHNHQEVRG